MARKCHSPEQVLNKLRQVEVTVANGKTIALAAREAGTTGQTRSAALRAGSITAGAPNLVAWKWTRRGG